MKYGKEDYLRQVCNKILFIIVLLTLFSVSSSAYGAIIFQDNFDNAPINAHTGGIVPSGWREWHEQGGVSASFDSITHYAGEISTPGRGGSGKSLKIWRHSTWPPPNGYSGGIKYDFPVSPTYRELYIRYYMKLPSALNIANFDNYLKLWRFNTSSGKEYHLNFGKRSGTGSLQAVGDLRVLDTISPAQQVLNAGSIPWDNKFHCYEFHIKLNTSGRADGILEFWLDGVRFYSNSNYNFNASTSDYFVFLQHFSVGNRDSESSNWQNTWQAFEFDDLVLSTTYVGADGVAPTPDPSPNPTAPNPPSGLRIISQ